MKHLSRITDFVAMITRCATRFFTIADKDTIQ